MEKTGGYLGTDMDSTEKIENLNHMKTNHFQAQKLQNLKKQRRQLREKILCSDNCQFEKWSFMTGLSLGENCPIDCPVNQLSQQFKYKTSKEALEGYNSYFDIRDAEKNKVALSKIDQQIEQYEQQFERVEKNAPKQVMAQKQHKKQEEVEEIAEPTTEEE